MASGLRKTLTTVAIALAGCGPSGGGAGQAARCEALLDGDTLAVRFTDADLRARYAGLAYADGTNRVRLLGIDAPDLSEDRTLASCNDPADPDHDAEFCARWRDAWTRGHGTPTLDLDRIAACKDEGMAILRQRLEGRDVALVPDEGEGDTESVFGGKRLLRWVEEGGDDLSTVQVRNGLAIVFDPTPKDPCDRCGALQALEDANIAAREGCLWR